MEEPRLPYRVYSGTFLVHTGDPGNAKPVLIYTRAHPLGGITKAPLQHSSPTKFQHSPNTNQLVKLSQVSVLNFNNISIGHIHLPLAQLIQFNPYSDQPTISLSGGFRSCCDLRTVSGSVAGTAGVGVSGGSGDGATGGFCGSIVNCPSPPGTADPPPSDLSSDDTPTAGWPIRGPSEVRMTPGLMSRRRRTWSRCLRNTRPSDSSTT